MDLDSIIRNLTEIGSQLDAVDDGSRESRSPLRFPMRDQQHQQQQKKKTRHNVSFSDKPPVFYESEPCANYRENAVHIYEGIDQYFTPDGDSGGDGAHSSLSLASLLESRKSQLSAEESSKKLSKMDTELEVVLRELHVLSEECEPARPDRTGRSSGEDDDDDDDDDFPPPPPIPPPPEMSAINGHHHHDDDDDDDGNDDEEDDDDGDDTLRYKTSSRHQPPASSSPLVPVARQPDPRPLSRDSRFSSDSTTNSSSTNTNDSLGDKPHCAAGQRSFQPYSASFSGSLPQVSIHAKSQTQMCVKVYSEDGSTKTVAIARDTTVHQLCCILIKKYRHPVSKAWSLVEQWNDICSERLLEGHLRVVDEIRKWPHNSDNKLWFAHIPKKFDLFKDPQISESVATDSHVPNCEGQLYLKSLGKKSWKKFHFVLRSSGLYHGAKGKGNKSADLTCLSNLVDVDIYTSLHSWAKELKAPTRFGLILRPTGSSKLNVQNPLKCLCAEDGKALQKWVDALRLAKYGRMIYEDFLMPVVLPPPTTTLHHYVATSWSNLIEDELDRVANSHMLQKSSMSLRDCSRLNASLDSSFQMVRRPGSTNSDERNSSKTDLQTSAVQLASPLSAEPIHWGFNHPFEHKSFSSSPKTSSLLPSIITSPNINKSLMLRQADHISKMMCVRNQDGGCISPSVSFLRESSSFDKALPFYCKDDDSIKAALHPTKSTNEPVYDYINDSLHKNDHSYFNVQGQHSPCCHNSSRPSISSQNEDFQTHFRSQDFLNDSEWSQHLNRSMNTPLSNFCGTLQHPNNCAPRENGDHGYSIDGTSSNELLKEKFEFPPPPTPEIFQFLEMNKSDFIPQKPNHYEVPAKGNYFCYYSPSNNNGFHRQSTLNRSFVKPTSHLDHVYRALNNRYTAEPTEMPLAKSMHHSFHSKEQALISPKRSTIYPPTPPRMSGTSMAVHGHQQPNIPNQRSSRMSQGDHSSSYRTQQAIKLLDKMLEQKLQLGTSGPPIHRGSCWMEESDDLPPPPKEILENLKLLRSQNKCRFVSCNS